MFPMFIDKVSTHSIHSRFELLKQDNKIQCDLATIYFQNMSNLTIYKRAQISIDSKARRWRDQLRSEGITI